MNAKDEAGLGQECVVRYSLNHENGASDEIWATTPDLPIPRVGEYVTIDDVVHGYVFDVNYDYTSHIPEKRVRVCIACDGENSRCDWDCTKDHVREWRDDQ